MDSRDLECFGSSRCPRLQELYLSQILLLVSSVFEPQVVSSSESLEV
ncbi:hypothetical protein ACP70R_036501 [Stipagrostis hirtigluma subsp. patula]